MKKKIIIGLSLFLMSICAIADTAVFDYATWLKMIDQLYATYDMVDNTVTQIENQYRQIQHAVEQAKNIDWDNIQFDGDFDIRNDIKDANKRINSLLNSAYEIRSLMNESNINIGYGSYSIADLVGVHGNGKNLLAAAKDSKAYMTDNMKGIVDAMNNKLSPKEKMALYNKYGISSRNYCFVAQTTNDMRNSIGKVMSKVSEKGIGLRLETSLAYKNNIIKAASQTLDSDGNLTQGATEQATMFLTGQLVDEMNQLAVDINEGMNVVAQGYITELAQKEAEAEERAEAIEEDKNVNSMLPRNWIVEDDFTGYKN